MQPGVDEVRAKSGAPSRRFTSDDFPTFDTPTTASCQKGHTSTQCSWPPCQAWRALHLVPHLQTIRQLVLHDLCRLRAEKDGRSLEHLGCYLSLLEVRRRHGHHSLQREHGAALRDTVRVGRVGRFQPASTSTPPRKHLVRLGQGNIDTDTSTTAAATPLVCGCCASGVGVSA